MRTPICQTVHASVCQHLPEDRTPEGIDLLSGVFSCSAEAVPPDRSDVLLKRISNTAPLPLCSRATASDIFSRRHSDWYPPKYPRGMLCMKIRAYRPNIPHLSPSRHK